MSNKLPPPQNWIVWDLGPTIPCSLDPHKNPVLFTAFDSLRYWLLTNDKALADLASLTFDSGFLPKPPLFLHRKEEIIVWLCDSPPRVDFVDIDSYGAVADRRQTLRIRLARSFLLALNSLAPRASHPRVRSQLHMLLFLLERTLMHEIVHAARSVFSTRPSPPRHYGLHIEHKLTKTSPPDNRFFETHRAPNANGRLVRRGEHGWEMEARTGGEARLYVEGKRGIQNLDGFHIRGLAIETRNSWRYIDLGEEALLYTLAGVDWDSIDADLATMPTESKPSWQLYSVLRTAGDVSVACGTWEDEQQQGHKERAMPQSPQSPSPSCISSFSGLKLSSPDDDDDDDGDSDTFYTFDTEERARMKEAARLHFGKDVIELERICMNGQDV